MMTARCLRRLDLSAINPLLQRGIADRQNIGRFSWCREFLHGASEIEAYSHFSLNRQFNAFLSDFRRLVAQRLASLQGVSDAFLRLLFATQGDECFPL